MGAEADDQAPYLPALEPAVPPSIPDSVEPELSLADEIATRNVPTSRPEIDYGLPVAAEAVDDAPPEFLAPALLSMSAPNMALLVGRGLMVMAMLLVGMAAWRGSTPSGVRGGDVFWSVTGAAGVFVVVALAGLVFWSMTLAANARRLTARSATPRAVGWAWVLVVAWVAVSALTYLRVDSDSDFDPFPGLAGLGFAACLALAYARLHSVFRGMSRRPPKLALHAYPLDLAAFGLVWWRLTSWPNPVARSDADHVRLTAYIALGAAAALAINALVFVLLARLGGDAIKERLGRLQTRHRAEKPPAIVRPE